MTLAEVSRTGDVAVKVEVIVDGGVYGDELLKRGHTSESLHGPLSSSEQLMGIFGPIV